MILRGNDNKILRSASGEILKQPPIIDISSDYGVTKDGSNLVSKVKNKYTPNVFRAPSGKEPIENGNGFDFSATNKRLFGRAVNYGSPFVLEFWFYANVSTSGQALLQRSYPAGAPGLLQIQHTSGNYMESVLSGVSLTQKYSSAITSIPLSAWVHFLFLLKDGYYSLYNNGYLHKVFSLNSITYIYNKDMYLGGLQNLPLYSFNGNLNSIKAIEHGVERYNAWDVSGNVLKAGYAQPSQAFIPPTYPNTIL